MENTNRLSELSHARTARIPTLQQSPLPEVLKEWDIGLRDGAIRLLKFFTFEDELHAADFEACIGRFMRCSNLFVAVEKVEGLPQVAIEIRMRPEYETASVAAQIATECEREYAVKTEGVRQSAA